MAEPFIFVIAWEGKNFPGSAEISLDEAGQPIYTIEIPDFNIAGVRNLYCLLQPAGDGWRVMQNNYKSMPPALTAVLGNAVRKAEQNKA